MEPIEPAIGPLRPSHFAVGRCTSSDHYNPPVGPWHEDSPVTGGGCLRRTTTGKSHETSFVTPPAPAYRSMDNRNSGKNADRSPMVANRSPLAEIDKGYRWTPAPLSICSGNKPLDLAWP
jgi:hypothetical protein